MKAEPIPIDTVATSASKELTRPTALLREAGLTFWLNIYARATQLIIAVLLARWLGVAGFGAFGWAMGWVGLLSVAGGLGFVQLLVREVSAFRTRQSWAHTIGLIRWADRTALLCTTVLGLLGATIAWLVRDAVDPLMLTTFWASLPLLPLFVLMRQRQAALRGLMQLIPGQLAESAVLPTLFLLLLGAFALFGGPAEPWLAMLLQIAAAGVACLYAHRALRGALPPAARTVEPLLDRRAWFGASLGIFFITAARVANSRADVILVGALSGAEAAGLYNAAARGAELVSVPLLVAVVILGPRFAQLHTQGALRELRRVFWLASGALATTSALVLVALVAFQDVALSFFGPGFIPAGAAMTILSLGQWVNAATGPVSLLMVMTGRERTAGGFVATAMVLNVVLNLLLIPRWGIEGAAVATSLSSTLLNGALLVVGMRGLRGPA